MPSCTTTRLAIGLVLVSAAIGTRAQNASNGSAYSAYGFGDLFQSTHTASALMGGTGIAYTEPYSLLSMNPASYAAAPVRNLGGLQRPVFDAGLRAVFLTQRSADATSRRSDAEFAGFGLGIPFGRGRWGMAFGISPFSDVGYSLTDQQTFDGGTVKYEYTGSGGLSRVYAGLARALVAQRPDSAGNLGSRLVVGANFEFLFGGIEQTRKAIYPLGQAYTNTSAYASLVLRAPTGTLGLHYSNDLTSKQQADAVRAGRVAKEAARIDRWKAAHVDVDRMPAEDRVRWNAATTVQERIEWLHRTSWRVAYTDSTRMPVARTFHETQPWRWTFGATAGLPTVFSATSTDLVTTFFRGSSGIESVVDTIPSNGTVSGSLTLPMSFGAGFSIHNDRWLFTLEARQRDWSALKVDVDGYALPSPLRNNLVYAAGARFRPSDEGGLFQRTTYRAGIRYAEDYLEVRGTPLSRAAATLGASFPLNHLQTNSHFHCGVEYGQRGTTGDALLRENSLAVWIGLSITPRRGRGEGDWFLRRQIQ